MPCCSVRLRVPTRHLYMPFYMPWTLSAWWLMMVRLLAGSCGNGIITVCIFSLASESMWCHFCFSLFSDAVTISCSRERIHFSIERASVNLLPKWVFGRLVTTPSHTAVSGCKSWLYFPFKLPTTLNPGRQQATP